MVIFIKLLVLYCIFFFGMSRTSLGERAGFIPTLSSNFQQINSNQLLFSSVSNKYYLKKLYMMRGGSSDKKIADNISSNSAINISSVHACNVEHQNILEHGIETKLTSSSSNYLSSEKNMRNVKSNAYFNKFPLNTSLINLTERVGSATSLLLLLYLIIDHLGEKGINALVFFVEIVMYSEVTKMIDLRKDYTILVGVTSLIEKWWWFATVLSCMSIVTSTGSSVIPVDLIRYIMIVTSLVVAVVRMSLFANASSADYRTYLGRFVVYHFALIFLLGHSCFWNRIVQRFGVEWVIYPALLVIVNDTMAYFFGKTFGNHQLLPRLSPNKTVEGFVGAAFSTYCVSFPLLKLILRRSTKRSKALSVIGSDRLTYLCSLKKHAWLISTYVSFLSPFGGFLASAVKRAHGSKDFGTSIAGHGGFVDRLDCQLITAPFVYFYLIHCANNLK